jgi:hypothetical protein
MNAANYDLNAGFLVKEYQPTNRRYELAVGGLQLNRVFTHYISVRHYSSPFSGLGSGIGIVIVFVTSGSK